MAIGIIEQAEGKLDALDLVRLDLAVGRVVRHFKGKNYYVHGYAEHTETGEIHVIYQALYGEGKYYCRPAAMFLSLVDREKYSVEEYPQLYRMQILGVDNDGH